MPRKQYIRRKIDKKPLLQEWPEDVACGIAEVLEHWQKRYKYVRIGVTTDLKQQYDYHYRMDDISWTRLKVVLHTDDPKPAKLLLPKLKELENYIDNNIHFPTSLFDEHPQYFVYMLVGKRKKSKKVRKNNFTLTDFYKKKLSKVNEIYDENSIDEEGNLYSFDTQAAIITHHLTLKDTKFGETYQRGSALLQSWNNFVNPSKENSASVVSEEEQIYFANLFDEVECAPFKSPKNPRFTFIDLFAGIGGFRLALQDLGGLCTFSSEWDENAKSTYYHNFGEIPFGDITQEYIKKLIPKKFDVLCAGFPCQAFSIAGYRKGFEDTRGTLFFDVAEIIRRHRPKAVYLENVKNLFSHDNGNTFEVIKNTLEQDLGYKVFHKVMNAMEYANVPQNRERIFIVCFDPEQVPNYADFMFPEKEPLTKTIHDCIARGKQADKLYYTDRMSHIKELREGIVSKDSIYQWRRQYVRENKSGVCPTLTANMGTGGHNVPLILTDEGIRKLTPKECINFQGYPENYDFPTNIADSAKYKQAGNSVVVPLIHKVCKKITSLILS